MERDVTQRKRLQIELLHERNLVRSVIDSLDSALYAIDRRYRLTHFNDVWRKTSKFQGWLEFETPPLQGKPILDYVPEPSNRHELSQSLDYVLTFGEPKLLRVSNHNGRHCQYDIVPWVEGETCIGLLLKATDITQDVGLQNQLYQAQKMETIGALAACSLYAFICARLWPGCETGSGDE